MKTSTRSRDQSRASRRNCVVDFNYFSMELEETCKNGYVHYPVNLNEGMIHMSWF